MIYFLNNFVKPSYAATGAFCNKVNTVDANALDIATDMRDEVANYSRAHKGVFSFRELWSNKEVKFEIKLEYIISFDTLHNASLCNDNSEIFVPLHCGCLVSTTYSFV